MTLLKPNRISLPKGFLLGASSSAHQVEGNNTNNDWWHYEQAELLPKSGVAADHYNRYQEDFGLAKQMGLNAMRISVEWSRIEPEEGHFDHKEIEHYRAVLLSLKKLRLTRMVTLHHFTLPWWVAKQGGFQNKKTIVHFTSFAKFVAEQLGTEVDLWCTINEPEIFSLLGYMRGWWPPFKKSPLAMWQTLSHLIAAHKAAYRAIKSALPSAQIGIVKNNVYYEPARPQNILDRAVVNFSNKFTNEYILNRVKDQLDFIGLNYYFYHTLRFHPFKLYEQVNREGPKSDMGWRTYPNGLYFLLKGLAKYGKPIYVTENGIANARDDMRKNFITEHLAAAAKALAEGVDVRGYFYWSLTDTYEWHDGFNPKFGLVEIDFNTEERRVRPSSEVFKQLSRII